MLSSALLAASLAGAGPAPEGMPGPQAGSAPQARPAAELEAAPRIALVDDEQGAPNRPLAPDLAGIERQMAADSGIALDAGVADLILSAAAFAPDPPPAAAPADLRWRLRPLPPEPSGGLAGQTAHDFGSDDGLALLWRHEIDGSATLSNALRVRHASGPVDAQLAVIGRLSFLQGGPMALSYRSSTSVAVLPFFTVGADAHGPLGTLSAIRPGASDSVVEPHMKLTLPLLGATAGASTGWRVPTGTAASADPDKRTEFHWKLTFQKKL